MTADSGSRINITRLILVPSIITLAITILRLAGELNNWSDFWFSRQAGGGGSPIGISWLAPIFGIYFALKLSRAGEGPSGVGRVVLYSFLSIVVFAAFVFVGGMLWKPGNPALLVVITIGAIVSLVIVRNVWPILFKTLLAYGFAARIPVAILMFIAIRGNWGTHYDVVPPPPVEFPAMHWVMKWLIIGAVPQLGFWIMFTVTTGLLLGGIAVALFHRGKQKTGEPAHA